MGMNVAAMNNMAVKSQMVGFIPNQQKLQEMKKEQEHSTTITEMEKQDTSNSSTKGGSDNPNQATDAAQARSQQAANQARRRQISLPENAQRESAEPAESKEQSQQAGTGSSHLGGANRGAYVPLDNTARINFQFKAQQRASEATSGEASQARPEVQKRQFLTRLRTMVNLEYQQYVKSDTSLYTRRNLREIAAALGEPRDGNVDQRKLEDNRYSHRDVYGEEYEGFNKFNQMRANRTVSTMQKYMHEPPQDQLSLVA